MTERSIGPPAPERIRRAWRRAGVSEECELCGHLEWAVVWIDEIDGLAVNLRAGRTVRYESGSYLMYGAECQNCGNVRLFSKSVIDRLTEADVSE